MSAVLHAWPVFFMAMVVGVLLAYRLTDRPRPPITVTAMNFMESSALAGVVHCGVYYVVGVQAEWSKCYEFANLIIEGSLEPDEEPGIE